MTSVQVQRIRVLRESIRTFEMELIKQWLYEMNGSAGANLRHDTIHARYRLQRLDAQLAKLEEVLNEVEGAQRDEA